MFPRKVLLAYFVKTLLSVIIFSPQDASAVGNLESALPNLGRTGEISGTSESGDIQTVVGQIINAALTLVGTLFFALMVYAGYLWMTARGDEPTIEKAKEIIKTSIIGLVILVSAYAITVFVTERF